MADDAEKPSRDYRETVFLPETPFPMRAGLPQKEPQILARWSEADLYHAMRAERRRAGAPLFVLHDGPPYANGAIHIGHALQKTLKDFVVRSRFLLGYDVDFVPGWDCHGLPIEWKIEEELRAKGRRKDEVSKAEFRQRCREYAAHWIDVQREGFKRLGVIGDWENRYATMDFASEAAIVAEFHKFVASGQLYRGSKPVMWSPVERTALADAEVEYHDHVSPTIWVKFPVTEGSDAARGASVVIWTTTPWTIPANRAISYNPDVAYSVYEVEAMEEGLAFEPWAKPGDRLIVADKLVADVMAAAKVARHRKVEAVDCQGMECEHPLAGLDSHYGFGVPLLAGDHVTDDAGTGFVHTAPGHGADDYQVWLAHGHREIPDTVDPDGAYYPHVALFGGLKVLETEGKKAGKFGPANDAVIGKLIEAGRLLARGRLEHSYPHSWRSKAPVIFRNTPQWFIRMDEPVDTEALGDRTLRETALEAIEATTFYPPQGKNRIRSMVESRPDWLISRQRAWGAPLAMFVDKETGQPLHDPEVDRRIIEAIRAEGADAWFNRPATDFLGSHDPDRYEKVEDILDVWFDSGSTHAFTLENRANTRWPADLYLEGSDQHRGWFQSSLLESSGTRGRAPYDSILTHGFVMDEHGEKMSKSKGNVVDPERVIGESGAEIIRLWTAMIDYSDDCRIGKTILQTTSDAYRKLRNTVRYMLGALADYAPDEAVELAEMPPLERFILHRLWELDGQVRAAYEAYAFQDVIRPVLDFCQEDLSALFFDVRRDSLYCDRPDALRRRAARTVMDAVFERITAWLSPLIPFTMEEAWLTRYPDAGSNCLRVIPDTPAEWRDDAEAARWAKVQKATSVVTGALEVERREKRLGAALEAAPRVHVADADLLAAFEGLDPAEVFRTSQATLVAGDGPAGAFRLPEVPGVAVEPLKAEGRKCARSWRILPEVGQDPRYPDLSLRDADAVAAWDAAHGKVTA
ncbi:isoleucyl-tRNA synthetase protein [Phenylobacterium zucineum HLK1]|uniref:Isoleucine--tRNA ligase n=1 Tax=Phenylobacterium zucineum (strain HLK1) TaxID=450851 RepID=B4RA66_PHEZH|nr:isoleucine--tRNA ligase [Phenylobacterium zucineum]ACG79570.1 isoleucyl-tRNA synthetase protein [Phenylobacterium zucineum HLK1]